LSSQRTNPEPGQPLQFTHSAKRVKSSIRRLSSSPSHRPSHQRMLRRTVLAEVADRPASEGPARLLPACLHYPVSFARASWPSPSCPALPEKPARPVTARFYFVFQDPATTEKVTSTPAPTSNPPHKGA